MEIGEQPASKHERNPCQTLSLLAGRVQFHLHSIEQFLQHTMIPAWRSVMLTNITGMKTKQPVG